MTDRTNYYEILEIPTDADERQIKRAYHRLARDLHPDKATTTEQTRQFEEQFARVSAAYNTLKDSTKRAEYDKKLKLNGKSATSPAGATATSSVLAAGRGASSSAGAGKRKEPTGGQARVQNMGITPERVAIAQKAYVRGMQHFKEGNFVKAVDFFEAAIQNNDGEPAYHARLGLSLIQARRSPQRAIAAAQRAIDLDPYNVDHKFALAFIFETIGSKTNARKVYEDVLRWDEGNNKARVALAGLDKGRKKGGAFGGLKIENKGSLSDQFNQLLTRIGIKK